MYYINSDSSKPYPGKILVRISSDNGASFGKAQLVTGLQEASCDPNPVVCSGTIPSTYSISGTISGDIKEGVTLTLSGDASNTTTSAADGTYSFANLANGNYTVTPSLEGYSFKPANKTVKIEDANVGNCNFISIAGGTPQATGQLQKLSFTSSYKEFFSKSDNKEHFTNKFNISGTIQFGSSFDLTKINKDTRFSILFGNYLFSDTLQNSKKNKLDTPEKGGSATFLVYEKDTLKNKNIKVLKLDLKWNKNKILTVKITGTPVTDSETNILDLSKWDDGKNMTGKIETFELLFNNDISEFSENQYISFSAKKSTKNNLINWSAKGKK